MRITGAQKNKLVQSLKFGILGILLSFVLNLFYKQHYIIIETSSLGFLIGFLTGLFEYFIAQIKFRKMQFLIAVFYRSLVYMAIILFSFILLAALKLSIAHECTLVEAIGEKNIIQYSIDSGLYLLLLFLVILSFFINILIQISHLFGPGELLNYILGRYNKPALEQRIFLFMDLDSSTSIAEKLGTEKYSAYLKDFFSDLTEALVKTGGQVFQYVGDEAVVVWKLKDGLKNNNAVKFTFFVRECIDRKKDYYLNKYGIVPEFKAGMHMGETIITEVGEIKKEIVYHGELLNATARIRSMAKEKNKLLIISDSLLEVLKSKKEFIFDNLGCTKLRGKDKQLKLYSTLLSSDKELKLC
jgi:adenylate cyclase